MTQNGDLRIRTATATECYFIDNILAVELEEDRFDWAEEIRVLLEEDFPGVKKIALGCDNLTARIKLKRLYPQIKES